MRNRLAAAVATALTAASLGLTFAPGATALTPADAKGGERLHAIGLTADQTLVDFPVTHPDRVRTVGAVTGLTGDARIVGIDYRVQNGLLYGVGDQGGIYTLDDTSGCATKVSQLTVPLQGAFFGVDFNPAANRLRVISDTGQNLRHNLDDPAGTPAAGTTVADGTLTNPAVPPATTGTTALGVTAAAYTNNDLDPATATTLFDLDTTLNRTVLQSPANAGTLAPTGALGVDPAVDAGFDIYYSTGQGTNHGYAALEVGGTRSLYRVDVLTGRATALGAFAAGSAVTDLALPIAQD
ncbi:DUF4394 domain-containing protein [Kitasatospora sp. NPDC058406]|uniref:DUF4394 domain-containing protein n=1 Tax=Streptomycetaceae TaxID=2062 RepID=UPI002E7602BF|nr:DUF4394 domain-containing protein [Streptomyces sp. BE303]MED7952876.1 DUF4394 domain-containing protein [Streptomyces sp. BE303]